MPLITIRDLSIRFRGPPLLDNVSCQIDAGQRIGLLGRNGSGKTTLMRMLLREVEPDSGEISFAPGICITRLAQDVPHDVSGPVASVVLEGTSPTEPLWDREHSVEQILSRMELPADAEFSRMSSGMKRRVLLAKALVRNPDILLLDEPTNHLDIEAIDWLEQFLSRWPGTFLFVTHDRVFLRKLATRILEIDRAQIFDWSCDYDTFLNRKEAALAAQEKQDALFDKKLAQEEVWIRTGIKARRTRNEGRVRALEQMRRQRQDRPPPQARVNMAIQEGQRSGMLVADVDDVTFGYSERPIVRSFSTSIMRGDKVGIIGRNGAGKTTLLRILLGQLQPQQGTVRLGTNLQIAYFDQLRQQLDDEKSVQDNVGDGYDTIKLAGGSRHVVGYLRDFLFSAERVRMPVRFLSGGERNRVLLAKLFAKPANVIVLDEPTNDLDAETLELLEERLVEYDGTVLVVSHDREFLNNVATSTIVFEEAGVREYVGGYDDWIRQRAASQSAEENRSKSGGGGRPEPSKSSATSSSDSAKTKKRKLSFKEQQELSGLPARIEELEANIATMHDQMSQASFYQQPGDAIAREQSRLKEFETQLAAAYSRWEELESLA